MSGIDRNDQMISYYSSHRRSIRWYKKVIFHLLDVSLWNAYLESLIQFRENDTKYYLKISNTTNDGRTQVRSGPAREGKRRYIDEPLRQENEPPHYHNMHFPDTIPNVIEPQ